MFLLHDLIMLSLSSLLFNNIYKILVQLLAIGHQGL